MWPLLRKGIAPGMDWNARCHPALRQLSPALPILAAGASEYGSPAHVIHLRFGLCIHAPLWWRASTAWWPDGARGGPTRKAAGTGPLVPAGEPCARRRAAPRDASQHRLRPPGRVPKSSALKEGVDKFSMIEALKAVVRFAAASAGGVERPPMERGV